MSSDWDVVRMSKELEAALDDAAEKRAKGIKLTPHERGKLGGLSIRDKIGHAGYRDLGRKAQAARASKGVEPY